MQNVTKFLEMAASLFIFCIALTFLLYQTRLLNDLITAIKAQISNQDIFYEQERSLDEIQEGKVSYAEVIATLFGDLDYDIQINNMTILKENYNCQIFDFTTVPKMEYTKSYQYDSSGNIVKVIYKS